MEKHFLYISLAFLCLTFIICVEVEGKILTLFEDDNSFEQKPWNNDGGARIECRGNDVFTGKVSARVSGAQVYNSSFPDWSYRIVEKPSKNDEFRWLMFAWKKIGTNGIMIQFPDNGNWGGGPQPFVNPPVPNAWGRRYIAGNNFTGWSGIQLSNNAPKEWTLVIRDLYADFGEFTMTGIALTPFSDIGLYDSIYLAWEVDELTNLYKELTGNDLKPSLSLSPVFLDFGFVREKGSFTISNNGGGNLHWEIEPEVPEWIKISPISGSLKLGQREEISVTVSRTDLPPDIYTGNIYVKSNEGDDSISIKMEILKLLDEIASFRGHTYRVIKQVATWYDAKLFAESLGGHLVTISDLEENLFVCDLAMERCIKYFWVGLTDELKEGHFVWVTGEPVTYTNWNVGEPNNLGNEDYAEVESNSSLWNDIYNDGGLNGLHSFVVEFEIPGNTTISIKTDKVISKGNLFSATINVENVNNMAGFQMDTFFDPAILEAIKVEEGTFLSDSVRTQCLEPVIDNTKGQIIGIVCAKSDKGGVNGSGILANIEFKAIGIGKSQIKLQNVALSDSNGNLIKVKQVEVNILVKQYPPWDVNSDGIVNVMDFVIVGQHFGEKITQALNVNNPDINFDGVVDIIDFVLVGQHFGETYSPAAPYVDIMSFDPAYLHILARIYNIMSEKSSSGYNFLNTKSLLSKLLSSVKITKTEIFQNYPNPFNPETWIPYQLKESSNVIIRIYSISGELINELRLGYKLPGSYISQDKAAHWDGTNQTGEYVSSGIYFCNIQAGRYNASRKMVVRR